MSGWQRVPVEQGPLAEALVWLDQFPATRLAEALLGDDTDWTDVKCVAVQAYLTAKTRASKMLLTSDIVSINNDLYCVDRALRLLVEAGVLHVWRDGRTPPHHPMWQLTGKSLGGAL